jgi:hypothetical protein
MKRDELISVAAGYESKLEDVFSELRLKKSRQLLNRVMNEVIIDALDKTDFDESSVKAYLNEDTKIEPNDLTAMEDVLRIFRGSKSSEVVNALKGYKFILSDRVDCKIVENL